MKSFKAALLLLVLLPALGQAEKKPKKPKLPEVFEQAHLVYVQAVDGNVQDSQVSAADRAAIAAVSEAVKAWGRYTLTTQREKADLVILVRKGRPGEGQPAAGIAGLQEPHSGGMMDTQSPNASGAEGMGGMGGGAAAGDDLLKVCTLKPDGKPGPELWSRASHGGLDVPRLSLFAQLREAVEKAYPSVPAGASTQP